MCLLRRRDNAMARERIKMRWRAAIIFLLILAAGIFCWIKFGKSIPLSSCRSACDKAPESVAVVSDTQVSEVSDPAVLARDEADDEDSDFTLNSLFGGLFDSCGGSPERTAPIADNAIEYTSWDVQPDAQSYLDMMREKYNVLADDLAAMPELERTLARCGTSAQVCANERYIKLYGELMQWCYGAQGYPADGLDEHGTEVYETAGNIAVNLQQYLELYPQVITGEYRGSVPTELLLDTIMDDTVYLYELLYDAK